MKKWILLVFSAILLTGCNLFTKTVYLKPESVVVEMTEVHTKVTDLVAENEEGCVAVVIDYYGYSTSSGSGFIFDGGSESDKYYYVFTNMHVVFNKSGLNETSIKKITVKTTKGNIVADSRLFYTAEDDIAIIRIPKTFELKVLTMGDSRVQLKGSFVFAIGSPLGVTFFNSVAFGVFSSNSRAVDISLSEFTNKKSDTVIQHDCVLNPGNSGGALFNLNGEVIGINQSKAVNNNEVVEGISFAIRIEVALDWAQTVNYKA